MARLWSPIHALILKNEQILSFSFSCHKSRLQRYVYLSMKLQNGGKIWEVERQEMEKEQSPHYGKFLAK